MYSASNGLVLICYIIVCYPAMSLAMLSVTVIPSSPSVLGYLLFFNYQFLPPLKRCWT